MLCYRLPVRLEQLVTNLLAETPVAANMSSALPDKEVIFS